MNPTSTIRSEIDAAIAAGQSSHALALTKQLWFSDSSLPNAPFVIDRLGKLSLTHSAVPCKILILRSYSTEPLVPLVRASAACWGIELHVQLGQFNSYAQEILDPQSMIYREASDIIVIAVQTRDIAPKLWSQMADLNDSGLDAVIERVIGDYRIWVQTIRSRCSANVILHNLEKPIVPSTGVFDSQDLHGQYRSIDRINAELTALANEVPGVYVLDYDGLVARHGRENWGDKKKWLMARLPFAANSMIHMVNEWMRFIVPLSGKQAKCLVCDLDNTLWGGVIGEDGLEGIKLGAEYPGAAYQELQRVIIDLTRRGILIATCSKNNEADAMEAIDQHPGMLLRSKEFSIHRINWEDKAENLRQIANELNIGIDSLVFLDDNPVERELIREMLPQVTVIDIEAKKPFGFVAALRNCPRFERLEISGEDQHRNEIYVQQRQRSALAISAATVEDYLRSLNMVVEFGETNVITRQRIAQLTQKTNQLNMTTRRYSEQQIQVLIDDPLWRVYWARVSDRFGDNGIVGVMIVHEQDSTWEIDTFLMSCRVIGRTVETAMLGFLVEQARLRGVRCLQGFFIPTAKNAPAKEIYASHGFHCRTESEHESVWELDVTITALTTPEWFECQYQDQHQHKVQV